MRNLLRRVIVFITGIDSWHQYSSKNYVDYVVNIAEIICGKCKKDPNIIDGCIVEIGCGLGDIIGRIKERKKMGFDISNRVVWGARLLHPFTSFRVGSFDSIRNKRINCLIIVNILHFLEPEYVDLHVSRVLTNNVVDYIIIDEVRNTIGTEYKYEYDGNCIFGEKYTMAYRSRRYMASNGAYRYIVAYKRV